MNEVKYESATPVFGKINVNVVIFNAFQYIFRN